MAVSGDVTENLFDVSKRWLLKAVTFDSEDKLIAAFSCYKEGLDKLMEFLKTVPESEVAKRTAIRTRLVEYLGRAESLKKKLLASGQISPQSSEPKHTQYRIGEGETGYGYDRIFGDCFKDASVVWIRVEDPYIRKMYQLHFFLQFCELCASRCPGCLQEIHLVTGPDEADAAKQRQSLDLIAESLAERGIQLRLSLRDSLHDREVYFSNGWRVKIGRGLSLYRKLSRQLDLGTHDLSLRQCLETTVDIFHESILR
ncbi:hypothetical protein BOX15_Mlig018488g1 [Macrostomum lignano]|uniref:MIT domain-containing protein n=1 Tax=Macrostomum lignano TaxID=282301 RepID=A0A267GE12_9PLAT|nr:hypothetical protein BOX15_Mlig018488g1 [Macrostomum lignano]